MSKVKQPSILLDSCVNIVTNMAVIDATALQEMKKVDHLEGVVVDHKP